MNIRLFNAKIYTPSGIKEGDIIIKGNRIHSICDSSLICSEKIEKEIDCKGNLIIPGFVNGHTHSAMTFLRTFSEGVPLNKWLNEKVFPYEAKLSSEDIYTFAKLAILEYLSSGITQIFDMYIDPIAVGKACDDLGIRASIMSGVNNFVSGIENVKNEHEISKDFSSLISYKFGFHAPYTCDEALLKDISDLAHNQKVPIYAHVSETKGEYDSYFQRYGMSPLKYLDSLGLFDFGGAVFHMVWLNEEDYSILSERKLSVVTNPASNCKLASGIAPVSEFVNKKINVSIGTDGPASNNALDMFREMYLCHALSNIRTMDANSIDAMDILQMATQNGNIMTGVDAGTIEVGKIADLVLIDINSANMKPSHDDIRNVVLCGSKSNVLMTIVDGNIRYKEGIYYLKNNESVDSIIADSEKLTKKITG